MPHKRIGIRKIRMVLAAAALAFIFASCSSPQQVTGDGGPGTPTAPGKPATTTSPAFIATVTLKPGQTGTEAAEALGGRLVTTSNRRRGRAGSLATESGQGVAFLVFDEPPVMSQAALNEFGLVVEANQDRFVSSATLTVLATDSAHGSSGSIWAEGDSTVWAEGDSTVWAEGDSTVWAEGDSTVWAEGDSTVWAEGDSTVWAESNGTYWSRGDYKWMPPNTAMWRLIDLRNAHREARNFGNGVRIAVIDSGVDTSHPWLSSQLAGGWDFIDDDDDPSEEGSQGDSAYGHGTSVAGIIRQIAPRATIVPLRVLSPEGYGDVLHVVQAVYAAVDEFEVDIINLSLGGPSASPALNAALDYAASRGVLITTSAGNEGQQRINFPGAHASTHNLIISVTSVGPKKLKSPFANYHNGVEISAPGEMVFGPYPDNRVAAWSGTSMAAPVVAGALALALGEGRKLEVKSRAELVREMFSETSNVYVQSNNQYRNGGGSRNMLGAGLLDVGEFLDEVLD